MNFFLVLLFSGTAAIVLGIIAGVFLLTSFVGFCGLYSLLGFTTCAVKKG
ncbi:MAG: DUF2892 domain-containing protein [Bacteroidales bacterium]|nr:DUF2892 domain-containing protein [Bacteroidales bacterium]